MQHDADVIISGAGPSGSMAAYHLASKGFSVLILEKTLFPRYKVCGGGLTHKILKEIPFDLSAVIETTITNVTFSQNFGDVFTRHSDLPIMYCTMRPELDSYMAEMALKKGARLITGQQVTEIIQEKSSVEVRTQERNYRATLVIGSDGASGAVARFAGLRDNILTGLAWEAEIAAGDEAIKKFSETVFLDWGTFPGGYGWMFPKSDHFSIGVGGPASLSKWMMPYYHQFLRYLVSETGQWIMSYNGELLKTSDQKPATISLKSWPIPVRVKKSLFHKERILVAGDAGGLSDPLTGEGIYYAVRSGILAAEASADFLNQRTASLNHYSDRLNDELMAELIEANRIKYLFNTMPARIHHFIRDTERGWRAFGKVLRGERWYKDVRLGFGRWKFLWGAACRIAWVFSERKEHKFGQSGFNKS
jgi:geranylgeranyl reductase family protein